MEKGIEKILNSVGKILEKTGKELEKVCEELDKQEYEFGKEDCKLKDNCIECKKTISWNSRGSRKTLATTDCYSTPKEAMEAFKKYDLK